MPQSTVMTRLPKDAREAVGLLGIQTGSRVLALSPDQGFIEALAETVGEGGRVVVQDPPADLEAAPNVHTADEATEPAQTVIAWLGPVPTHAVREQLPRVAEGGTLWTILPRPRRGEPARIAEADVKRALLVSGWRDDRTVPLATDSYAIRFRRRR